MILQLHDESEVVKLCPDGQVLVRGKETRDFDTLVEALWDVFDKKGTKPRRPGRALASTEFAVHMLEQAVMRLLTVGGDREIQMLERTAARAEFAGFDAASNAFEAIIHGIRAECSEGDSYTEPAKQAPEPKPEPSTDIPLRILSGERSVELWEAINAIKRNKTHRALYTLGCRLQELEEQTRKALYGVEG